MTESRAKGGMGECKLTNGEWTKWESEWFVNPKELNVCKSEIVNLKYANSTSNIISLAFLLNYLLL
ncbi:MAG: hypothetical protein LBV69_08855 [Bacteroidales bacterium]|jgi:hypothetical protein|nr:hypothetical protein [Bacteroidales bacterium]